MKRYTRFIDHVTVKGATKPMGLYTVDMVRDYFFKTIYIYIYINYFILMFSNHFNRNVTICQQARNLPNMNAMESHALTVRKSKDKKS